MTTIDNIIFKIESYGIDKLPLSVPMKDKKILKNMSRLMKMSEYITESQGNLVVKILKENLEHLNFVGSELIPSLKIPNWSKAFKSVEKIRKISIDPYGNSTPLIEIEASHSKDLKRAIVNIQKNSEGDVQLSSGRKFWVLLTEKNVVSVIEGLKKYNFEKSSEIIEIYKKIKNINFDEVVNNLDIEYTDNEKLKNLLKNEIFLSGMKDALMLHDRKIAYQYVVTKKIENLEEHTLLYKIATRENHKIFINSEEIALQELSTCLRILDRMPVLLIFDEYNTKSCVENLKNLKNVLDTLNFKGNVGVYFRFDNDGDGQTFNKLISDYGYNKPLNQHNQIAVLSNGKIPKFFLKTDWYPKSVISFTNHFRNNKTSVYCNECDLIVYYTGSAPLIGSVDAIV